MKNKVWQGAILPHWSKLTKYQFGQRHVPTNTDVKYAPTHTPRAIDRLTNFVASFDNKQILFCFNPQTPSYPNSHLSYKSLPMRDKFLRALS